MDLENKALRDRGYVCYLNAARPRCSECQYSMAWRTDGPDDDETEPKIGWARPGTEMVAFCLTPNCPNTHDDEWAGVYGTLKASENVIARSASRPIVLNPKVDKNMQYW